MSLDRCLQDIAEVGKPLRHVYLIELSSLTPQEMEKFLGTYSDITSERRREVVAALVELAEDNAELDFGAVFRACLKDPDDEVREKALSGLWEEEDRGLIPELLELLRSDPSHRVRSAAATALGTFVELAAEGKLLSKDREMVKEYLMQVLKDSEEPLDVRRRGLEALAPLNTGEIREYIRWAYNSPQAELQCSAFYAMGRSGEADWLPLVLRGLSSEDPSVRYEAVNACGVLGEEEAIPHLIRLLEEDDLEVQLATIQALGEIGGPLAKKALKRCIRTGDASVEEVAMAALEKVEVLEDPLAFKFNT